ncbi:322_t:CDS:2 [Entrophospora sp. SA101]|nr:322_t:CDS:2 [Entrophospora sp. SA101]
MVNVLNKSSDNYIINNNDILNESTLSDNYNAINNNNVPNESTLASDNYNIINNNNVPNESTLPFDNYNLGHEATYKQEGAQCNYFSHKLLAASSHCEQHLKKCTKVSSHLVNNSIFSFIDRI